MPFYELAKVKQRLNIADDDSADDNTLNAFGKQSDSEISDTIYSVAAKKRKLTALPVLDVSAGTIGGSTAPQSVKDASSNMAVSLFKASKGDIDAAEYFKKLAKDAISGYIERLNVDKQIYGRIVH